MKKRTVKILAHRGYSSKFHENTQKAFEEAIKHNITGLELDIQKTKDNVFIIMHDSYLERVSGSKGFIKDLTIDEIRVVKVGKDSDEIMEFEHFLKIIPKDVVLNIELKNETVTFEDCREIFDLINRYRSSDNTIITSFSEELLAFFRNTEYDTGILIGTKHIKKGVLYIIKMILTLKPDYINLPIRLFRVVGHPMAVFIIRFFRLFGKKIMFWTINTEEQYLLIRKYSDFIITNDVENLEKIVRKYSDN